MNTKYLLQTKTLRVGRPNVPIFTCACANVEDRFGTICFDDLQVGDRVRMLLCDQVSPL